MNNLVISMLFAAVLASNGYSRDTDAEVLSYSSKKDQAAVWYSRGNSIIYLSFVGFSASSISHQPEIAIPIYLGSLIGQYSGLAVVGSSAASYCGEPSSPDCHNLGWSSYWISLATLGVFYFEVASIAIDESRNRDFDETKALIGFSAGATSILTYLYSWYSFYRIKSVADEKASESLYGPIFEWDGKNGTVGLRMTRRF